MCACTETDVRKSANDCTLASREGHSSREETFHPIYDASPVSSSGERTVYVLLNSLVKMDTLYTTECKKIKIESNISGDI
jgi:hypothetical protein